MNVREFDFDLPAELIAQEPPASREAARLMRLDRETGAFTHHTVADLPGLLRPGDLLVVNNTRVFPARLLGQRAPSGGAVECLLVGRLGDADSGAKAADWEALMHPGQKLKPGARVIFEGVRVLHGEVLERRFHGRRVLRLWTGDGSPVDEAIDAIGHVPLPPYIKRDDRAEDRDRYQTMFARDHSSGGPYPPDRGSVAAPTAGLHFTPAVTAALDRRGVELVDITLHVGYGTFQPVRVERVEDHRVKAERYAIGEPAAAAINRALDEGRRVMAVGTTTTRAIETVARESGGRMRAGAARTDLFIHPGFEFRVVSGLMTNFHLPRSSLLMLVSAFAGTTRVLEAYRAAIEGRYRFYSYGDAMLIL